MATATSTLWDEILARFRADAPHLFRAWFCDLRLAELDRGTLVIEASNESQRDFLGRACQVALTRAAQAVTQRLVNVECRVNSRLDTGAPGAGAAFAPVPPACWVSSPMPGATAECSFDNFVVGPANKIAHGAATAVAEHPGSAYNPLLIVGPPGTGKTHLLRAIERTAGETAFALPFVSGRDDVGRAMSSEAEELSGSTPPQDSEQACGARIAGPAEVRDSARYWTAAAFTAEFVKSLESGTPEAFRAEVISADLLLIDDVDQLAWKERTLEELFHVHQSMIQAGRQLVFSSRLPLDSVDGLSPRLTSRMTAGLVVNLEPPSFETRCLIIAARAEKAGIDLTEEVTHYLARKHEGNVADLVESLSRVIKAAQSKGVAIDLSLTRHALREEEAATPVGSVIEAVSTRFDAPKERLAGEKPGRRLLAARDAAVYLSQRLTPLTVDEIGSVFGGLTATQVVEIGRRVERERAADKAFSAVLDEIAQTAKNAS